MWRWRRQPKAPGHFDALVGETEHFLQGRYLDDVLADGRDIPSFAWLAVLAHGDATALELAADWSTSLQTARPEYDTWRRVLQQLAREVLHLAATSELGLDGVQRALLVPLELDLLAKPAGPATMYRAVSSILSRAQSPVDTERN